jgi:hypothetical protein
LTAPAEGRGARTGNGEHVKARSISAERRAWAPGRSPVAGRAGLCEDWLASWDRYEAGVEEYLDAGVDRVVLCWHQGSGPGSDAPVHMDFAQVCRVKDGLVYRIEDWSDREQALHAVGLRE